MNDTIRKMKQRKVLILALAFPLFSPLSMQAIQKADNVCMEIQQDKKIVGVKQINPTTVELLFSDNQRMAFDFYGENIFRVFQDVNGGIIRDPEAKPEAQILVDNPRKPISPLTLKEDNKTISISTKEIRLELDKSTSLLKVTNLATDKVVLEEVKPVLYDKGKTILTLKENPGEYFYGGGVQNGRFSHKGKAIAIENQNSWTDGGVASPAPYYWSTNGYGFMWYTFKQGKYDFGAAEKGTVILSHDTDYLDAFYMVNDGAVSLLNDFYQLTGNPVLLPKFGFYQGHLNAYNRDYWVEDEKGILFEDGKRYKESQKDNGGVKESLNGEKNNYQFSARAVIDRYKNHDMPFGWLLPNDGYGAGYGQTETLDGNIQNLKSLADYAHKNGVEIGLWTQSDLHPKPEISALLQRDIVKEVRDAGVRVLKTDVAWVGAGYSFGLNGVADVGHIMPYYGNDARPFIISLDGWAGTQRYAGIWSGDQTGGQWEYIRFHIPTYIGSGLSGQPNITSDMDGIFGGKNLAMNTRDFQWKTWTPMQLNMDGWGANEKYPHALGEPATSINRWYLKMKSEFMPYAYSIAKEAINGKPMIRAMFLEYPNKYTLGTATRYQFMYGPSILVAPVYQNTKADKEGNDVRNGIYLPEGNWIDYFTGEQYAGDCIINNFDTPLWKLPVFIKQGAILPMTKPHNNVSQIDKHVRIYDLYPYGNSTFTEYDDDGTTEAYRNGAATATLITSTVDKDRVRVTIAPTSGSFPEMEKEKVTILRINVTAKPQKITAKQGNKKVKLVEVNSSDSFDKGENVYYYEAAPNMNSFATPGTDFANMILTKNPVLHIKLASTDITVNPIEVEVKGFVYQPANRHLQSTGTLTTPQIQITEAHTGPYSLTPSWDRVENADYYEIEYNGMNYTTIRDTELLFEDLTPETTYEFKLRAVNKDGKSDWSTITATTKSNPLEFAITGIQAETTCENQRRQGIDRMFNFDESDLWHTKWQSSAVPFELIMDLRSINVLDKFEYLPRQNGGNGTLQKGIVYYSRDKVDWQEAGTFEWQGNDVKTFIFKDQPVVRYIKIAVSEAVGNFGSGRELYVFKVPGSESYIPGDINLDGKLDENDLTSYMNYTGLRKGDADFDYVSKGDLNNNGLIDAYDISAVAIELEDGVSRQATPPVAGNLSIRTTKQTYHAGEVMKVIVKGIDLQSVNALSFALPYDTKDWEFVAVETPNMKKMKNLTYDRLHTNGTKALYPTFVNLGEKPYLEGNEELIILKFKARRAVKFNLKAQDGILVDKNMNVIKVDF